MNIRLSNRLILIFSTLSYKLWQSKIKRDFDTIICIHSGLRTLCVAQAEISEEFYAEWEQTYYKACTAIQDRDKKKAEAAELIEINLHLVGATAIEDKLQEVRVCNT